MTSAKKTMLSAIQPSNRLTIGNYLGALKNWVKLQHDYDCIFFSVNLHAITVRQDPAELKEQTYRAIATYLAAGINADEATLFIQSQVPEHAELAWVLNCFTYMGELGRMTQYKDKSAKQGQNIPAGLFSYPTLMAADILLYRTHLVPVGEDQKQHIELTRDIAIRMNNLFGKDLFQIPEVYIPPVGARIMSLQAPTSKMSKSDTDVNASVYLNDTDDQIRKKVKRAVTDSGTEIAYDEEKPGVRNLLNIQSALTGKPIPELVAAYAGKQYGHLKVDTAELVVEAVGPIRNRTDELMKDHGYLEKILAKGAERARTRARTQLKILYDRIGLVNPNG
ncbi:MAG: tryptophan--tRNA ligase [Bdellovibrionales bacterium GWB1_55_8]|nr:MAG: tryptophan--tRNA ligase [Bdellovibrionales bacterium GWB1_55_8]